MRLPRFRFTIRRMMVAVATLAVVFGGLEMNKRRRRYMELSNSYKFRYELETLSSDSYIKLGTYDRRMALRYHESANNPDISESEKRLPLPRGGFGIQQEVEEMALKAESDAAEEERMAEKSGRSAAHYLRLQAKYERAARYPWLPVAPDPHEPE